ncbi:MAG: hypothetical protein ABIZ36_09185, partial [Gemmatimonadaceae bacterium]
MKSLRMKTVMAAAMVASMPVVALAQTLAPAQVIATGTVTSTDDKTPPADTMKLFVKKAPSTFLSSAPKIEIQHIRATDMRGLNVYESPKDEGTTYNGFKLSWGAGFTQQFQGLDHSNTASPKVVNGVDANKLIQVGHGFNNAEANLFMNAQVAKGIRVALTSYLSTRHHNETWVKDGYFLIDASPIDVALLNNLMKYVTLRVGHFEINYGDAHFRRTDGGNAIYNPLVGNYIMDAFTTEIGGEMYVRKGPFLAMAGMTAGEVRGQVAKPNQRAPSYLGKLGFDKQLTPATRVRLTGSLYQTAKSINNTLYSGDRAGSRYYDVLENTTSTETAQAWSGAIQPGLSSKVRAIQLNPFVKINGFEFFGIAEKAKGRNATETTSRTWTQYAGEGVYRFMADDRAYVAARYNTAEGKLLGMTSNVNVNRYNVGGGWFITPNVLMKGEWVNQ